MVRLINRSAAHTARQVLKGLVITAAIAMGSPQAVNAESRFGNVTAGMFTPTVTPSFVVDADDANDASSARVLESADGAETLTIVADEPQPRQAQTSPQSRFDTRVARSDLRRSTLKRPPGLLPLYVTFATLQMLDAHSTTKALQSGGVEGNTLVASFAGNSGALYAVKIGTAAETIYLGEKIWRKNRFGALLTMVAVNSAYAMIVQHNYGVANRYCVRYLAADYVHIRRDRGIPPRSRLVGL